MVSGAIVKKNEYRDSVFLMRVAKRMGEQTGIKQTAVLMGTDKNKQLLSELGFTGQEISGATASDLILAVQGSDEEAVQGVLGRVDEWLRPEIPETRGLVIRSLEEAVRQNPQANLAVISLPGEYAGRESQKALENGLNVFLFSNNVPLETEISLKRFAGERGLIVMGPDCGTSIINGIGLGFANVVHQGPIGIIGPSGTGIQEFTTLVHRYGSGISQAIGTGSQDLSDAVAGASTFAAFEALEADSRTQVIAIVSKPPGEQTLIKLIERMKRCRKPVVACFLGTLKVTLENPPVLYVRTLEEAAVSAVGIATGSKPEHGYADSEKIEGLIEGELKKMSRDQRYIRGIFAGGTFCYQAQQIFSDGGVGVWSNAPLKGNKLLQDPRVSQEHSLVDLGAEFFTEGKPHPMIDSSQRRDRIMTEGRDPQVAVILLDFILGFNASPDPVGEVIDAVRTGKNEAAKRGGYLSVVASICGTEGDHQDIRRQTDMLTEAGVNVFPSSAGAALFCRKFAQNLK